MGGDVEEVGVAAEASTGGPRESLPLFVSSWARSLACASAFFSCLRIYSRDSCWLNWAWTWVVNET